MPRASQVDSEVLQKGTRIWVAYLTSELIMGEFIPEDSRGFGFGSFCMFEH